MPLVDFLCPDNARIPIKTCLSEGGCRMGERCASRSYLQMAASDRPWKGKSSCTQCISGTLHAFLKITKPYATAPDGRAFMINGTRGHSVLEDYDDECSLLELKFTEGNISGIADCIEIELGKTILSDNKVSGSYKVAKALGFKVIKEETGVLYKTGPRAGQSRTRSTLVRDPEHEDRYTWELQLNKYRMDYEKEYNTKVDELKIQCIVRDGNTQIARSRGLFRNVYYFKIKIMPDSEVQEYFDRKDAALHQALKQGYWKEVCNKEECWDGLMCQRYCDVAEHCPQGKYLKKEKETEDMAIKGLSEVKRLPRMGKIRLGIKKKSAKTGKDYPTEVDYFVLDPSSPNEDERKKMIDEFHKLYGDQPKSIEIMFPVANPEVFFPQDYKRYGSGSSLKCKGDGEKAVCATDEFAEGLEVIGKSEMGTPIVKCLGKDCIYYSKKQCSEVAILNVLLPKLPGVGVWQIATGSINNIINLNSSIQVIKEMCGRVHMIPLELQRRPEAIAHEGKKTVHYLLHISTDIRLAEIQRLATIDPERAAMELPAPELDKEDLAFRENKVINTVVDEETGEVLTPVAEYSQEEPPPAEEEPGTGAGVSDFIPTEEQREIQANLDPHNPQCYQIYSLSLEKVPDKEGLRKWNTMIQCSFKDKQITANEKTMLLKMRDGFIKEKGWL